MFLDLTKEPEEQPREVVGADLARGQDQTVLSVCTRVRALVGEAFDRLHTSLVEAMRIPKEFLGPSPMGSALIVWRQAELMKRSCRRVRERYER